MLELFYNGLWFLRIDNLFIYMFDKIFDKYVYFLKNDVECLYGK